jgi:type IV pilus assembly protein PilY1
MRRILPRLLVCALQWMAPVVADDIEAYPQSGAHEGVYVHVVMDMGDAAVDSALCTYGVDCGPPFTTESAHRHLGDMHRDGEGVAAPGLFRAVLAAVIDDPRLDELRLSLLVSNHHDNPVHGAHPGTGGGTILHGYRRLAEQRAEILRTLKSIPTMASPTSHEFQPKETYLEWLRYIAGGEVALGQNTQGNFGRMDPQPDYDAEIIADDRYLTPFSHRQSCPRLYSILFTQGASQRDEDLNAAIATQLSIPDQTSFEQLLAYLHDGTTDLLPQAQATVPLQKTWVVTSRDRAGRAEGQAVAGGGSVWFIDEPRQLQSDLTRALGGVLATGSQSVETVFVEDTFRVGRVLDDLFITLVSPRADAPWPGNLKKLKLGPPAVDQQGHQVGSFDSVVDAEGLPAIETDGQNKGQLRFDALTFWTDVASLPPGDGSTVPLRADGRVVARGGAGQKIDGFVHYAAEAERLVQYFIGDTNADAPVDGYGPRQLYYEPDAGVEFQPLDASIATVAALRPLLDPDREVSDDALIDLIRWTRGQDTANASTAARPWLMGEILHSRPLALNYGATPGYSRSNPNVRLLFGSGEGLFHIVENTDALGRHTGRELFGFYPREMLRAIADQRRANPNARPYGVDGAPVLLKHDRNRDGTLAHTDGDSAWVYFGLRRGGSAYFALDVSDPETVPRLMWTLKPTVGGSFDGLGMTFATPVVGKVNYSGVAEDVVIFGGGYHGGWNEDHTARIGKDLGAEDDAVGNAIYIVNARTGELVWKAESGTTGASSNTHYEHAGLVDSIPSTVSALVTPEGVIHRLYVGDTGGAVWRVDLPPRRGDDGTGDENHRMHHWFITKLADLGADAAESGGSASRDLRFFHAPDIVHSFDAVGAYDGVLIQSGDREHPNETLVENALFFIRDRHVESGSDLVKAENDVDYPAGRFQYSDLEDRTACVTGDEQVAEGDDANACAGGGATHGWKSRYARPGEKGVSPVLVDGGRVFATTFVPGDVSSCPVTPGRGQLHVLRLADASAAANQQRSYDLGEGIPAAVQPIGESLFVPAGGADIYDLDGDGIRDTANLLPGEAVKRYRTHWREPGVDPL